jgi:hypothetical protein
VRQPYLEEIIQSILRRQNITADAQTFIQKAQDGSLIFIFDGLDEKLVHYTKDMRQQFLAELMRVFPTSMFVAGSIFVTGNTSVLVDIDMGLAKQF